MGLASRVANLGIERLSKLPPGFSHELPAHLAHAHKDELTGLPITVFEDFCCGAHGLSILIVSRLLGMARSAAGRQPTR